MESTAGFSDAGLTMPSTTLAGRSVISVTGEDAQTLLQGVITTDLEALGDAEVMPGALLSPQGKILFDFLVSRSAHGLRLEVTSSVAPDLARRLTLYRMRAKAEIVVEEESPVGVSWSVDSSDLPAGAARDRRFPDDAAVFRLYGAPLPAPGATPGEWTGLRIAHGVAEGGEDYALGDAFPHDVNLDQTSGVSFKKGCFIGQEVVSRMQHRGTARRRVLIAHAVADLPAKGTPLIAGGREVGVLGSVCGREALALARIDRVKAALDAGEPVTADGMEVRLDIPPAASFAWPQAAGAGED